MDDKGDADKTGNDICNGLGALNGNQPEKRNAQKQNGNGHSTGPDQRQSRGNAGLLNALIQHIHRDGKWGEHDPYGIQTESFRADSHHLRTFLEEPDNRFRKEDAGQSRTTRERFPA